MVCVGAVGEAGGDAMGEDTLVTVTACQSRRSPHAGQVRRLLLGLQFRPQLRHVQVSDVFGTERCGHAEASGVHAARPCVHEPAVHAIA